MPWSIVLDRLSDLLDGLVHLVADELSPGLSALASRRLPQARHP
jgi:hypothetical protein